MSRSPGAHAVRAPAGGERPVPGHALGGAASPGTGYTFG
ncbi:hypothetical protein SAMN05444921_104323 [Streptomyces wuyuanensis]|uniref:Uncharacterized protein n=1 Tax=Streptomyces wuyuanensis TaxID=1196353 RepID=A0A1G9QYI1_9ACTN|nr:hypothetical protein SAMN05444921_104323 [Streptomyces wuyuanensis]